MMVDEKRKEEISNIKEIRKKLEAKIEGSLPEEFKQRHAQAKEGITQKTLDDLRQVDEITAKRIIEAVLFSSAKPVSVAALKKILKGYRADVIAKFITELADEYERENRSFTINEVANGYELVTKIDYFHWLSKAEVQKKTRNATHAMLETLAVLAYKQPVTRNEIEELRGVDCSGILATLLERNFIKITGRKEVPGRPLLYATTERFLEHFGLRSLSDLPRISEIREIVEAAIKKETLEEQQREEERLKEEAQKKQQDEEKVRELAERQKEIREQFDAIAGEVEGVKVLREKDINGIVHPADTQSPENETLPETPAAEAAPPAHPDSGTAEADSTPEGEKPKTEE